MICRTCIHRASAFSSRRLLPISQRTFATTIPRLQAAAAAEVTPSDAAVTEAGDAEAAAASSRSICPKGTVLNGLNYFKGKQDPVALNDDEYPEWLWDCLDVQKKDAEAAEEGAGDEFSKSKKQRRLAAKKQRELEARILATGDIEALAPKIPLQQQSINLPGAADGTVQDSISAAQKREELRKAMRKERKAKIKEDNYLKSM